MKKNIEYNGKKYKITHGDFGFTSQQLFVNGTGSNIKMNNSDLDNVRSWKKYTKLAIEEYEARIEAKKEFEKWDGKL